MNRTHEIEREFLISKLQIIKPLGRQSMPEGTRKFFRTYLREIVQEIRNHKEQRES